MEYFLCLGQPNDFHKLHYYPWYRLDIYLHWLNSRVFQRENNIQCEIVINFVYKNSSLNLNELMFIIASWAASWYALMLNTLLNVCSTCKI